MPQLWAPKEAVLVTVKRHWEAAGDDKLLLPGPTLSPSLLSVLVRFREHSVGISSDIYGMFHQLGLLPEDMPLLRFLWRDMNRKELPGVYEWHVLLFSTTSSPSLLCNIRPQETCHGQQPPRGCHHRGNWKVLLCGQLHVEFNFWGS